MKTILKLALVMTLIFSFSAAYAAEKLNGAGATFPYPVYSAWAFDYNKVTGVQLNYQSIGSGGGVKQITARTVDFGASDEPLKPEALAKEKLLQFPAVIGGVVPVANLGNVKPGQLKLDSASLCKIFLGDIKYWDDAQLVKMNQGLKLPHSEITVVYRSDGSGTTAIFTEYLNGVCPAWKDKVGAGKAVKFPVGIGGKGNEGVANYVKRTANSIGYVEFAYAKQNKLDHTQLKNAAGNFVEPSFESFEDAAETGDFNPQKSFYLWLTNAPGKGSWPIAGATFILLAKEKTDSNKHVVKFFDWAFKNGDNKAKELVYVPLPKSLKDKIRGYWKANGLQ
ncbi:MAG: phosphate ABC transporter substrate-binding protein PstS [Nitrospiraceae bacterium]|jgi:phosphate transport system substrate-binding protein|nr:MAG: phosphate ABC transporter substrate-binding protein PstS [Nitrospiraceae bacterium]